MSDYNSSLPIRTENAGDAIVKIADATIPSQQLAVEADGSINVNGSFSLAPGSEIKITDGTDDLAVNADGSINAVVTATNLDVRDLVFATDKIDASGSVVALDAPTLAALENITVSATDLDIRNLAAATDNVAISDGIDTLAINTDGSLNVRILDSTPGTAINNYNTSAALAGGASNTHTYTSVGNFYLTQIEASASGKMKIEVQVNGTARFVQFNSTAVTNLTINLSQPILVTSGQTVTVIRTNRENQSQDVYSTISGYNE